MTDGVSSWQINHTISLLLRQNQILTLSYKNLTNIKHSYVPDGIIGRIEYTEVIHCQNWGK